LVIHWRFAFASSTRKHPRDQAQSAIRRNAETVGPALTRRRFWTTFRSHHHSFA